MNPRLIPMKDYWDDYKPTTRASVDPGDFLPRGHEESFQREYENHQYRRRYGSCANMYDNNSAAKEACLQGLGR